MRDLPAGAALATDLCIVGGGPAGLTLVSQFIGARTRVFLLESGGMDQEPETEALNDVESVGLRRAPQNVTRRRGLGGSSAIWSGRCGTLDAIDYQCRSWIADSGWPISAQDLEPYLDRAGEILGLGPGVYGDRLLDLLRNREPRPTWDRRTLLPVVWQYSKHGNTADALRDFSGVGAIGAENIGVLQHAGAPRPTHFGEAFRGALQQAENVCVLLHANATQIETDETGERARSVEASTPEGRKMRISASHVVLCCGGIDNARLLLASRSVNPRGVGNDRDVVGRYLMDHPYVELGAYEGRGDESVRRRLGLRWLDRQGVRHVYQLGVRMSPAFQRRNELLNCAVQLNEFGDSPPVMSCARRVAEAVRCGQMSRDTARNALHALRNGRELVTGIRDRYLLRRPNLPTPSRVVIGCVVEQAPDPSSRITLSEQRDNIGIPRARIDWRAADLEFDTARELWRLVQASLARIGAAIPAEATWLKEGSDAFRARIHDMAHPIGTTRMAHDPRSGVVDANCAVHGVGGLYCAGSSVFSTAGYMNPTLMIVALSLRLADHLKISLRRAQK
jgi:choline dehydrogenase-like flavoprotein